MKVKRAKRAGWVFRTMERGLRRPRYAVPEARGLMIEKKAAELNQAIPTIHKVKRLICENSLDEAR